MAAPTGQTVIGVFQGISLATAFTNPGSIDILQIVNVDSPQSPGFDGMGVVWNLSATGVATANPVTFTKAGGLPVALYQQNGAASLAAAFTNPQNLDLIQVISPNGGAVVFRVDYLGNTHNS